MPTFASITPTPMGDGIIYGTLVPLTTSEATLGDGLITPDPIPVVYGQIICAVVKLTMTGIVTGNNTYVIMQTDLFDNTWIDAAWCVWNGNQGTATFVISGGIIGASSNVFQQTRQAGSPPTPQTNGSNSVPLAGRIRFVGKSTFAGGSSSLAGVPNVVKATITYKILAPR